MPKKTLKVGYFDIPPHIFSGKKEPSGATIIYFNKIAQEMGVEVEYTQYTYTQLLTMLERQMVDVGLSYAKNEEREKFLVYPSMPFITAHPVFAVNKNSRLKTLQDIENETTLKILVWKGGFHSPSLANSKNTLTFLTGSNIAERGLTLVVNERFDAFFGPDLDAIAYQAKANKQLPLIRMIPITQEAISIYTVFTKQSAPIYLGRYEQAVKKVQAKTTYEDVLNRIKQNSTL